MVSGAAATRAPQPPARRPPPRGNNNGLLASLIRLPFEILGTALTAEAAGLDLLARAASGGAVPGPLAGVLRGLARAAAALAPAPSSSSRRGGGSGASRVWRGGTATIGPAHSSAAMLDGDVVDDDDEFVDPLAAAARFAEAFRERYGDGGPAWAAAPWASAADAAARAHRLCFVYLHAPRHDATDRFCRETLCDAAVARRLAREFVCWGGDVSRSPEAHALAGALGARAFPFAALLVKCSPSADSSSGTGGFSSTSRTATLAARAEGPVSAAELGRLLDAAAAEHGPALAASAAAAAGRERDRALRAEQDAEFEAALLADQAKARERERARELEREAEREAAGREREARAREAAAAGRAAAAAAALEARRAAARAALPAEEPSSSEAPSAAIRVRLRDGSTHTRRFKGSDALSLVYTWVDSLEAHSSLRYSLAQSFPRAVLGERRQKLQEGEEKEEDEMMSRTLEELKLAPQAALFVQCGDDDEE